MAHLMIIDDDEDFASAAATVLRDAGHSVEVCLDQATATARLGAMRPDLIILDVMFPESDSAGFDMARAIRHYTANLEGVPVLMVTAVNARYPLGFSARDIDDQWLPVSDFLEKPVDLDVLRNRVQALLAEAQARGDQT